MSDKSNNDGCGGCLSFIVLILIAAACMKYLGCL